MVPYIHKQPVSAYRSILACHCRHVAILTGITVQGEVCGPCGFQIFVYTSISEFVLLRTQWPSLLFQLDCSSFQLCLVFWVHRPLASHFHPPFCGRAATDQSLKPLSLKAQSVAEYSCHPVLGRIT